MKYDFSKAEAVVDEYVAAIADKTQLSGKHNRTWLEFCMQRNGLIPNVRGLGFGESHALWYACLVLTGRVREVSRLETATNHKTQNGRTTETTIRRCLSKKYSIVRDSLTARMLREILACEKNLDFQSNPEQTNPVTFKLQTIRLPVMALRAGLNVTTSNWRSVVAGTLHPKGINYVRRTSSIHIP